MPLNTPVEVDFGKMGDEKLEKYVWNQIQSLKEGLSDLHENKVKKWRRLYRGVPKEAEKNFPWKNASNVVIQLIGQHCDNLRARVLGSIYEVMPIFVAQLTGDWPAEAEGEEQRHSVEEFMNLMALEPGELDLYRVESAAFDEAIKFGTVFLKLPWEYNMEQMCVGLVDKKPVFREKVIYDGPRPEKMIFEDFLISPQANTLEQAVFKAHRKKLKKWQLEERSFKGIYSKDAIEKIINNPDRQGPSDGVKDTENTTGAKTLDGYDNAEWDVYECWLRYAHNDKIFRIIYTYHFSSKTILKAIYNFYPENDEPFEMGRLGYTDDGIYGYGFCEMLEHYQEEVTTNHNQRCDNRTLANTSIFRVEPNSKLDSIFSIYPNAFIPAAQNEFEKVQLGSIYTSSVEEEHLTLQLADARTGVDSGMSASGGGTTNPKKGNYSAMGTFSVMQAGNRRVNVNITDMRYTHLRLGRKLAKMYAEFGIGDRLKYFGDEGKYLVKALEALKEGRISLPIRAATASINRELEKQNDMMLSQVMQRHHQGIAQILQAMNNPQLAPEMKEYFMGWISSSNQLMAHILRNFGHDDTSRLLPEGKLIKGAANARGQQNQGASGQNTGVNPVVQSGGQEQGQTPAMATSGGEQHIPPVPSGS